MPEEVSGFGTGWREDFGMDRGSMAPIETVFYGTLVMQYRVPEEVSGFGMS